MAVAGRCLPNSPRETELEGERGRERVCVVVQRLDNGKALLEDM